MGSYKGTGVVFMRELLATQSVEARQAFLAQLSHDELRTFRDILPISTVSIEYVTRLFQVGGPLFYPELGANDRLRRFGIEMARDNLRGGYRMLLKVLSVETLIKHSPHLWRTYHGQGVAHFERLGVGHGRLIVEGYPDLPADFREATCGFIHGAVDVAGATEIHVTCGGTPAAWFWDIAWRG